MDETFGDLLCATGIADDIVVYGYNSDFSDHDENLRAVLQRAHETGLRFSLDKCKFRCTGLPFLGHIIGAEGLQPDPRKIGSILSMSSPLHPQSNGLSERTVQTVKDLLHKCKESGQDPHLAMLCLRGTPLGHDLPSLAELLNGRVYQTNRKNRRHLRATGEHFQLQSDEVPDDVTVDESTSCAADPGEHSISSAPAFPVSAACSPAEPPESVLQSSTADLSPVQPLRKSNRTIKALDRLKL